MKSQFIQHAIQEAEKSQQHFKHGAILVKKNKMISGGHNRVTRKCQSHMFSIHAEMAAINHSSQSQGLTNTQIYVVRIDNNNLLADSKPCSNCQHFMKLHGITRVFFSTGILNKQFDSLYI